MKPNQLLGWVLIGMAAYLAYTQYTACKLPIKPSSCPAQGGGSGGGGGQGGQCTPEMKAQWASGIGLPVCVADRFCAEFGRLPQSLSELVTWGNARGYRDPQTGVWRC